MTPAQELSKRIAKACVAQFGDGGVAYTPNTVRSIRSKMQEVVKGHFEEMGHPLSVEAVSWLSDRFLEPLKVRDEQTKEEATLAQQVIINDFKLNTMPDDDIDLMLSLFRETTFGEQLRVEHVRRHAL